MTAQETTNANFFSTALTNSISSSDINITLDSVGTLASPAYLVIDPNSDSKREVILADGTWSGTTVTLTGTGNRGLDGSASGAQSHDAGVLVVSVPLKQHIEDINDRVDAISDITDHGGLTGLADDDHTQYLLADGTRALSQSLDETINEIASSTSDSSIDWHDGPVQEIVLDNSPTLTFANLPTSGGSLVLIVKQDATGSRTVTWPSSVDWPAATAPTLSTAANAVDIFTFVCDNTGTTVVYGFASGLGMG